MAGDKETQSAVFGLMQQSDSWDFTRQELGQLVTSARKEKEDAEAVRAAAVAAKEALEAEVGLPLATCHRVSLQSKHQLMTASTCHRVSLQPKHIQLMTSSMMVHVTNRVTPPGGGVRVTTLAGRMVEDANR
jgi:hypothetical protein